jgi:hypothetical protein
MKQLPLAPPRCNRFFAALVTHLAAGPSEACTVAKLEVQTRVLADPSLGQQILTSCGHLVIVVMTYVAIRVYDRVSGAFGRGPKQFINVASQTQTTFSEVRGAAQPRFRVLPEHSHA